MLCCPSRCRPSCVLLVDQFGNLHAPFAQARTFLSEHGFGDTRVVVHAEDGSIAVLKAKGGERRMTSLFFSFFFL